MFENIENYMKKSFNQRQLHLKLKNPCIEIGGLNSTYYTGLLAYYLKTTIPTRIHNICLCHACGNRFCSNPEHLYWGTFSENIEDEKRHGTFKTGRQKIIEKYGIEKANEIHRRISSEGGKKGGGSNKLSKSEIQERLQKISDIDTNSYGCIKKISIRLNISHTQARRFIEKYKK